MVHAMMLQCRNNIKVILIINDRIRNQDPRADVADHRQIAKKYLIIKKSDILSE